MRYCICHWNFHGSSMRSSCHSYGKTNQRSSYTRTWEDCGWFHESNLTWNCISFFLDFGTTEILTQRTGREFKKSLRPQAIRIGTRIVFWDLFPVCLHTRESGFGLLEICTHVIDFLNQETSIVVSTVIALPRNKIRDKNDFHIHMSVGKKFLENQSSQSVY
jgi:hypothetical protein